MFQRLRNFFSSSPQPVQSAQELNSKQFQRLQAEFGKILSERIAVASERNSQKEHIEVKRYPNNRNVYFVVASIPGIKSKKGRTLESVHVEIQMCSNTFYTSLIESEKNIISAQKRNDDSAVKLYKHQIEQYSAAIKRKAFRVFIASGNRWFSFDEFEKLVSLCEDAAANHEFDNDELREE